MKKKRNNVESEQLLALYDIIESLQVRWKKIKSTVTIAADEVFDTRFILKNYSSKRLPKSEISSKNSSYDLFSSVDYLSTNGAG